MTELVNHKRFKFVACDICKHRTGSVTCKAFPDKIPFEFISVNIPHIENELNQQGDFVFEFYDLPENASQDLKDFYKLYKDIEAEDNGIKEKKILEPLGTKKCVEVIKYIIKKLKNYEYTQDIYHVVKMLYFADRVHLLKYRDSIIITNYLKMDYGPVSILCYDIIKFVRGDIDVSDLFDESIKEEFKILGDTVELLNNNIDDSYLSKTNIECMNAAIAKYGKYSFNELKEKSHDKIYDSIKGHNCEFTIFDMLKVLDKDEKFAKECLQIFDNKVASVSESVQNNEVPF
jgi:uncharacterized phage-associated protein